MRSTMTALFVQQLTTLDFSYLCPNRGLVGESWLVDVTLSGDLDEQGMVFDFGHVKKQIKSLLDLMADHRLLVPMKSSQISVSHDDKALSVHMMTEQGQIICKAPAQAILLVESDTINTTVLKPILEQALIRELPENVKSVNLSLYNEAIDGAFYHYSHGLKKHLGDCQRIAHGHRSQIRVYVDNQRDSELEQHWANRWRDIYIATSEDFKETIKLAGIDHHHFAYISQQGSFELTIAADRCYLIDTDSTVELLAQHMAEKTALLRPGHQIKVMAYEGFNKGAVAESQVIK